MCVVNVCMSICMLKVSRNYYIFMEQAYLYHFKEAFASLYQACIGLILSIQI